MSSRYLPPLPKLPGEDEEYRYRPAGRSIITVLTDEHLKLQAVSAQLVADAQAPRELADVLTAAVTKHLSAEEQYLYPAVRSLLPGGDQIADTEIGHDTALLRELAQLEMAQPGSRSFHDLARSIDTKILRHGQACASQIFPELGERAGEADLIRLGNRIEVAEEAAPTRPHPDTPTSPPWNKVIDPAVGAVDRIRDGLEGRKTFHEDLKHH